MKDVKDFDDVHWDDGKPTVTDYVWGRDNQTASLIRAYKDEIERLRKENQELKLQYLSDQGQWIEETGRLRKALRDIRDYDGKNPVIYDADDAIAMKAIARAALGEKE